MSTLALILREALHRRLTTGLVLLALIATVALPVAVFLSGQASKRETIRLMRDLGYNLRIIPKETDMPGFWARGYSNRVLPEDCVQRFLQRPDLSYNHLIAMLNRRIDWNGTSALVTGIATEVAPRGKQKPPMIFTVDAETLHVGHAVAVSLSLTKGQTVVLRGASFRIAAILSEKGDVDDSRVYCSLADAQRLLGMREQINEIQALECHCQDPAIDTLPKLRQELESIIPEGRVLRESDIAVTRKRQRQMANRQASVFVSIVLGAAAIWIAMLFALNVYQRRSEIGTLRALGYRSGYIGRLFLGKAALLGLFGAVLGFALGTGLMQLWGPSIFATAPGQVRTEWLLLPAALVVAPLFGMITALVPTVAAVMHDPAVTLREDG
ncbi:MAG: FtsX-like permease family protein [Planctomycetota bacterium]|nr:FtsX-like permease family protein [Planctomycetota bacterium]